MTLLALFFSYQLNWIRQRHVALNSGAIAFWNGWDNQGEPRDAPGMLSVFGEPGYSTLYFTQPVPEDERIRIRSLFPETDFPQGCFVEYPGQGPEKLTPDAVGAPNDAGK
jgi:hypothetical protein